MHLTLLLTCHDLLAWLAVGGLPALLAPECRRLSPKVPPAVWRMALLGLVGLVTRALGSLVGSQAAPPTLEALGGHPVVGPLLLGAGLLGWARLIGAWRRTHRGGLGAAMVRPLILGLLPVALGLPWAMMPPWAPDESLYHLSLPLHGMLAGHTWAPLGHGNGGFFALGDHIAQAGLWMGSLCAARGVQIWAVVHAGAALWATWPTLTRRQVLGAQTLFLLSPVVLWQLGCAYVDILQGAFELVAVALLARFWLKPHRYGWAVLAALMAGCATGCKITGGVLLPVGLGVAWARRPTSGAERWPRHVPWLLLGAACLPYAPDLVHNLQRYHAPLFPFGAPLWPGGEALLGSQHEALFDFLALHGPTELGVPLQGWRRYLALPHALLFAADFASPRFDGVVGVLPLAWLLVTLGQALKTFGAAPGPQNRPETWALNRALQGYTLLRLGAWLCTSWQARFLIGPLWAMGWLVALGWPTVCAAAPQKKGRGLGRPGASLAALALALGMLWAGQSLSGHLPPARLGVWGKDVAQRRQDRLVAVPASALCDAIEPVRGSKVWLVWSQRLSLFCLGEQIADSYDEGARLKALLDQAGGSAQGAAALLRASGATHMLINEALTQSDLTGQQWQRYLALRAAALRPAAALGPYHLYTVAPLDAAISPILGPPQH